MIALFCFDVELNADTPGGARAILAQQKAFRARIEQDGVFGIVGYYKTPACPNCGRGGEWEQAHSVWGFAGYDDPTDPRQNAYIPDIMAETMDHLQ
jgi:hypothetical protein